MEMACNAINFTLVAASGLADGVTQVEIADDAAHLVHQTAMGFLLES